MVADVVPSSVGMNLMVRVVPAIISALVKLAGSTLYMLGPTTLTLTPWVRLRPSRLTVVVMVSPTYPIMFNSVLLAIILGRLLCTSM